MANEAATPEGFSLRPSRADDAEAIRACARAAYAHYVPRIGREPGPMCDDYARVAQLPMTSVLVRGHEVVGFAVLVKHEEGLLLDNVAVAPAFAGRGLGRRLMAHAESVAQARGCTSLALYTHALMHENLAMYAHLGYVEYARRREHGFDRVYLRKALDPAPC